MSEFDTNSEFTNVQCCSLFGLFCFGGIFVGTIANGLFDLNILLGLLAMVVVTGWLGLLTHFALNGLREATTYRQILSRKVELGCFSAAYAIIWAIIVKL